MKQLRNILTPLVLLCLLAAGFPVFAQEQEEAAPKMQDEMTSKEEKENTVDVKEIVFGHIGNFFWSDQSVIAIKHNGKSSFCGLL